MRVHRVAAGAHDGDRARGGLRVARSTWARRHADLTVRHRRAGRTSPSSSRTADAVACGTPRRARDLGLSAVVGTTGWYGKLDESDGKIARVPSDRLPPRQQLLRRRAPVLRPGRAARRDLVERAAPSTTSWRWEVHHQRKKDSPVGHGALAWRTIITASERPQEEGRHRAARPAPSPPDELHLASVRGGEVPGIHTVLLDSAVRHRSRSRTPARSRGGFAHSAPCGRRSGSPARKGMFDRRRFHQRHCWGRKA
ncbi:MAG: hypothetical protein MZV64_28580 [Ignavibacteriales bacterium]|nr:hypothetical protein [Ignavibacteriales bacterium]